MLAWALTSTRNQQFEITPAMRGGLIYARVVIEDQFNQFSGATYYEFMVP